MSVYFKSLIWLVSLGGIGYGLMLITAPSAEKLKKIQSSSPNIALTEEEKKKLLFMKRLKQEAGFTTDTKEN